MAGAWPISMTWLHHWGQCVVGTIQTAHRIQMIAEVLLASWQFFSQGRGGGGRLNISSSSNPSNPWTCHSYWLANIYMYLTGGTASVPYLAVTQHVLSELHSRLTRKYSSSGRNPCRYKDCELSHCHCSGECQCCVRLLTTVSFSLPSNFVS